MESRKRRILRSRCKPGQHRDGDPWGVCAPTVGQALPFSPMMPGMMQREHTFTIDTDSAKGRYPVPLCLRRRALSTA